MINIAEILKDCPAGTKLYSLLFGEGTFVGIEDEMFIIVETKYSKYRFDEYGKLSCYPAGDMNNGECLLFPSKYHRTWEHWEVPVEPKFKVGDWIVKYDEFGVMIRLVDKLLSKSYLLLDKFGVKYNISFYQQDRWRLWTIEDAKDGDVLVTTNIRSCPFIYRKISYNNRLAYYYAGIDGNGNFREGCLKRTLYHFGSVENVVPATKEQRDLLFAKMKEAGYEWDAEKKELKKIQPHYDISNFKAFDKVLVRDYPKHPWKAAVYSHKCNGGFYANALFFVQCIPYEGNEHLLGTTDMCDEQFINW